MSKQIVADSIPVFCAHSAIVDVATLVPNPRNPNKHPDSQIDILSRVIKAQGWRSPIVVSSRSGFVVKGHGRLQAAMRLGVKSVPVDTQKYETEAMEWADLIADNRIAELSEIQNDDLKNLMKDLESANFDLELTGYTASDLDSWLKEDLIMAGKEQGATPAESLEDYENSTVRQIVLIMDVQEFEEIMLKLDTIKKKHELDNNTLAAMTAIREHANTCN
jgi:ParB-like chromosome segregation protein Spo0J